MKKSVEIYHFSLDYLVASKCNRQAKEPYWKITDEDMGEDWLDVTIFKKGTNEEFWKNYRIYIHYTAVDIVKTPDSFSNKHYKQIASDLYQRID